MTDEARIAAAAAGKVYAGGTPTITCEATYQDAIVAALRAARVPLDRVRWDFNPSTPQAPSEPVLVAAADGVLVGAARAMLAIAGEDASGLTDSDAVERARALLDGSPSPH